MIATIAKKMTDRRKRVLFLVHRRELVEQIESTFKWIGVNLDYVQFGMVQTITRHLETTPTPALIITDENHHALARSYKEIYEYFKAVPRLGFTATPIRMNGDGLHDVNDVLVETVNVSDLIQSQHLAPYRYYAPQVIDTGKLKVSSTRDYTHKSMDDAFQNVIYGDVIKHYQKLADGEQAIAYCHSIESSIATRDAFNAAGISAAHIDAKTPRDQRTEIIDDFRNHTIKVLCNVDLIGEGFDVPDCSTVIMLRPTKSLSLFIQQSMRGMRYRPGKMSIIIDHVGNVNNFGLPDTPHKWTLEGNHKRKRKQQDSGPRTIQCLNCFGVYFYSDGGDICPYCGFKRVPTQHELEVIEQAKLEEVKRRELIIKEPDEMHSVSDLYAMAKAKGYKPGWAYMQAKRMGLLK